MCIIIYSMLLYMCKSIILYPCTYIYIYIYIYITCSYALFYAYCRRALMMLRGQQRKKQDLLSRAPP